MNKIYNPQPETWATLCKRPTQSFNDVEETVKQIFKEVQTKGDQAIIKYASFFDNVNLEVLQVSAEEIASAKNEISTELNSFW